jgi:hypothetical protein
VFLSDFSTFDNGTRSQNNVLDFVPHHNQLSVSESVEEEEAAIFYSIDNNVEDGEADDEFNNDSRTVIDGTRKKIIDKPKWLMPYIFLCLTSLPDIISKYGPLRL